MARAASPELGIRLACITLSLLAHLLLAYGALRGDRAPATPPEPLVMAVRWGEAPAASAPNAAPRAPKSQPAKAQAPVRAAPRTPRPPVAKPAATPVVKPLSLASARPVQAAPNPASAHPAAVHGAFTPGLAASRAVTGETGTSTAPIGRHPSLHNPEPAYPYESIRRGEEGKVVLRVRVTAQGEASEVSVSQTSGHRRLDQAARRTVARWRFIPGQAGGKQVAGYATVTIIFKLRT
ncbi:energy transducer TonB [Aeromonas simiae]|uniref:energy transducer TonB n=1 Tax=Aeromonas simiae TaxID=218936 RepID=UPI0005AA51A3|nr:energy transducer TonB [Aeromonas simiae]MDO2952028.1 energy transducer TonB [Aeromonas simiae]